VLVALAIIPSLLLAESRVQSQSRPWKIYSRQNAPGTGFPASTSVFSCQLPFYQCKVLIHLPSKMRTIDPLEAGLLTPPTEYNLPFESTCSVRYPQANIPVLNCKWQSSLSPVLITVLVQLREGDSYLHYDSRKFRWFCVSGACFIIGPVHGNKWEIELNW